MEEVWEFDPEAMSLRDFKVMQRMTAKGISAETDIDELIAVLDKLITNKSAEELETMPLRDLNAGIEKAMGIVEELSVPKASERSL